MNGRRKTNNRQNSGPDPPDAPAPMKKKKRLSPLGLFLIKLVIVAGILGITFTFILGVHIQHGMWMYPHLKDGDLLITYRLEEYRVGDTVVYTNPQTGETAVARIAAKGENIIRITEFGDFYINDTLVGGDGFYPTTPVEDGGIEYPYEMSSAGFFLLNDHRPSGNDSRAFGEVKEEALRGKVVYVFRRRGI